jgi:hypothetical protein
MEGREGEKRKIVNQVIRIVFRAKNNHAEAAC